MIAHHRILHYFSALAAFVLSFAVLVPASAGGEVSVARGEVDAAATNDRSLGSAFERPPWTGTPCPEMTDSITRLYSAFFQRQPDQGGFEFWVEAYSSGEWNLDKMARQFVVSDEFVTTYGDLTNAEFIDLLYQNVQGRPGDPGGRTYWLDQLDSGQASRGRVMIFFSESEEYVTRTGTVRPMAGYLGWYPEGTTWSCSSGRGAAALPQQPGFTDVLVSNFERSDQRYTMTTYNRDFDEPRLLVDETLPAGFFDYYRAREFGADDGYAEFDMSVEMYWTIVNYPTAMVAPRPGWD